MLIVETIRWKKKLVSFKLKLHARVIKPIDFYNYDWVSLISSGYFFVLEKNIFVKVLCLSAAITVLLLKLCHSVNIGELKLAVYWTILTDEREKKVMFSHVEQRSYERCIGCTTDKNTIQLGMI